MIHFLIILWLYVVDALQQIATEMGATYWRFNGDLCEVEMVGVSPSAPSGSEGYVECNCNFDNNTLCHVTTIVIKSYNLPGILPTGIVKLPYLQYVDFAYNLLTGTIPKEWASTQLNFISVLVNRLSGEIPKELGNITNLTYLNLEANQFSGRIPSDIGELINLKTLILSSNQLTGQLPTSFSNLINLNDFRINDNNLSGRIPDLIQNWIQLSKLEMFASGLEGPIPLNISLLDKLTDLRISDLKGPQQEFPMLRSTTGLLTLILRNCNITGEIPAYIWRLRVLQMLDVSFNRLSGHIPNVIARNLKLVFLTGNMMSGIIPDTLLKDGSNIDLSYNNFTWQGTDVPACQPNMNRNINLFKSSSTVNTLQRILPCAKDVVCPKYKCSLHVNCGGGDSTIRESNKKVIYEGDSGGDSARYLSENYWGFTSTGDFIDEPNFQNSRSFQITPTTNLPEMYSTSRLSPLSLTYFDYCLENGSYNVGLHFAEILFTNDSTYNSLGRRMFDIYIQEKLVRRDFNIEDEAGGAQRPVIRYFNVTVSDNTLEIRFYWASRGTTRIPNRGDYGSLISAISVNPNFRVCSDGNKNVTAYIVAAVLAAFVIFLILVILWWKGFLTGSKRVGKDWKESQVILDWPTRYRISIGIARGLAFLHEESRLKIVHRDIKATNVLLDKDLNAKISDFGLARLNEDEKTHISTKVAGTIGYMAPEYALWGYLTDKADVYSFGVVILEIVSGKSNNNYMPSRNFVCLLDWACHLQESKKIDELIDERLGYEINKEEIERMVKVALLCTNATPSVRPTMTEVVQMLEGKMDVPAAIPEGSTYTNDVRRISDLHGGASEFPQLRNMIKMHNLMLRSCNISGKIPPYLVNMPNLKTLQSDMSFNKLEGGILNLGSMATLENMYSPKYLTGNSLTGPIPEWMKNTDNKHQIDLSYNNFYASSVPSTCRETVCYGGRNTTELSKCLTPCSKDYYSFNVNCGGRKTTVGGIDFEGDEESAGSEKFVHTNENWGTSSTGNFWGRDGTISNYAANNVSVLRMNDSELYMTARLSPLSLTYYGRCLANGNYTVTLHFAEIIFRDNQSFLSLGRRMFDVYIQGERILKDFDIVKEAIGVDKAVKQPFKTMVTNKTLEIRFQYTGKGTTAVPSRGTYGPLVSAISVKSDFKPPSKVKKKIFIATGAGVSVLLIALAIISFSWWNRYIGGRISREKELRGLDLRTGFFTYRQIKAATNNFDAANKIGEGGFGSVYKALVLQKKQSLMELVDPRLGSNFNKTEAEKMIRVALLCTSPSPALRPTMSEVVSMLQGDTSIQEFNMDPSISDTELKLQAIREKFDDLYLDSSETQALVGSSSARENDTSSRSVPDFD
ncbi:hypothetical protein BUALT_Bualt03G0037400 [Buddleja alternifolia]|uniref:non-specific serine/threonine protein kinase n=1 Tax=Buddleja alternifolia TaxID=168488 RepID=A0AAV6XYB5_9LAMI|nr:hypothetical protein BUALT_Bualt03G0037400 [Buddleja alternifolia]